MARPKNLPRKTKTGPQNFSVHQKIGNITLILLDTRQGAEIKVLQGRIKLPTPLWERAGEKIRWKIPELREDPFGVNMDIEGEGMTVVFPFVDDDICRENKSGKPLSLEEIKNLFMKNDPALFQDVNETVKRNLERRFSI